MSKIKKIEENLQNVSVISLSKYTSPEVVETSRNEYVEYGADNKYPQYLIDRYLGSTTNSVIIRKTADMIFGKGLDALDSARKPDQYAQMKSLIKPKDLKNVIFDKKLLGYGAFQIVYENKKVKKISHFPANTLRSGKMNIKGDIVSWFYHKDWANKKPSEEAKEIKLFGKGNGKEPELYIIKSYVSGFNYYSPVDYCGAIPYALLEEEIADYLINDTISGFSGTKVINFNNGVPSEEIQRRMQADVKKTVTGARGSKVIVAFNKDKESATTVEDIPLTDAPTHYQYLSDECRNKLIIAHSVTSPLLLGIRESGGGLGSNADEIKNSYLFFDNIVIKAYQEEILNALYDILAVNNISLDLYFKTIQPLEFVDTEGLTAKVKEEETGIKASIELSKLEDNIAKELINLADDDLEGYTVIDERDVVYEDEEDLDSQLESLNMPKEKTILSKIWEFVSTGTAISNAKSEQDSIVDGINFKVRYKYVGGISPKSRPFCITMVTADKLYRKEDIIAMGDKAVNAGWGAGGSNTYSIWEFKGGGSCHHKWRRVTFMSDTGIDVKSPNAPKISTNKAEKEGFRVRNPKNVSMRPTDMPNNGFLNTKK